MDNRISDYVQNTYVGPTSSNLSPRQLFEQKIDLWRDAAPVGEDRGPAALTIKDAYDRGASILGLSGRGANSVMKQSELSGLSTLPDLSELTNLKALYVGGNQLTCLPDTLPASLEFIAADNNQLTCLPDNLPASLKHLSVCNNELMWLPDTLPASLKQLYVDGNYIFFLPEDFPRGIRVSPALLPVISDVVALGNRQILDYPVEETCVLISYALGRIEDQGGNISWALQNSGFINQLIVYASDAGLGRIDGIEDIEDREAMQPAGNRLREAYSDVDDIRSAIKLAKQMYIYDDDPPQAAGKDEDSRSLIFMSPDGQQGLIISPNFYQKNILGKDVQDDGTTGWSNFSLLKKNINQNIFEIQLADAVGDLQAVFTPFPLLVGPFIRANGMEAVSKFLTELNPYSETDNGVSGLTKEEQEISLRYSAYIQRFIDALSVESYPNADQSKRLVEYDDQAALWRMFSPHFVVAEREMISSDDIISDTHLAAITNTLGIQEAPSNEQADNLWILALLFTKFSSAAIFGKEFDGENISPGALRRYAVGLLNMAQKQSPGRITDLDSYKASLAQGECTNILFGSMKEDIKELMANANDKLKDIFERLVPKAWQ